MDKRKTAKLTGTELVALVQTNAKRRTANITLIAEELRRSKGYINLAAHNLGMMRTTLHMRISKSPYLIKILEEVRECRTDEAERRMHELSEQDEDKKVAFSASKYILDCHGKDRGYGKDRDVDVGGTVVIEVRRFSDELPKAEIKELPKNETVYDVDVIEETMGQKYKQ